MTDQTDNNSLDELSLTTKVKREYRGPVWDKRLPDL